MLGVHLPVLTAAVVQGLAVAGDGVYVDCTFGRGGHARAILSALGPEGRLLALDRDPQAVAAGNVLASEDPRFNIQHASFDHLAEHVQRQTLCGTLAGILFDLGVSSPQLDEADRGFSFTRDGPLDMRMDPASGQPVGAWLNAAPLGDIARVLRELGEERHARRIASRIVEAREAKPLRRTGELAELVSRAYPARERHGPRHPATRTFQALRIHANDELAKITAALPQALRSLAPGGRLAVITFHSLEDRIVKRFLRDQSRPEQGPRRLPIPNAELSAPIASLSRPIRPAAEEIAANPRARSATLRVAVKQGQLP